MERSRLTLCWDELGNPMQHLDGSYGGYSNFMGKDPGLLGVYFVTLVDYYADVWTWEARWHSYEDLDEDGELLGTFGDDDDAISCCERDASGAMCWECETPLLAPVRPHGCLCASME